MGIASVLRDYALADSAITNIVGNRFQPMVMPQEGQGSVASHQMPYVTYIVSDQTSLETQDGLTGTKRCSVRFECVSTKYDEAQDIAEAVEDRVIGCGQVWGIYKIPTCHEPKQNSEVMMFDDGSDIKVFIETLTVELFYHS
jgi:hypothetical protein